MDYGTYKNNLSVVLTQACTDTDTVLHIDNAGAIPVLNEHGLYLTFADTNEIVEVTSVDTTNNTITVVRGLTSFGGSPASSHNSGTKLSARVIAEHFDNLENNIENNEATINSHVNNTSNPHNVTASQVGAISKVEDDTSPKLGGDLDLQTHKIVGEGGTNGIYVDANGNVGIGTTNPNYKLDVADEIALLHYINLKNGGTIRNTINTDKIGLWGGTSYKYGPFVEFWPENSALPGRLLFTYGSYNTHLSDAFFRLNFGSPSNGVTGVIYADASGNVGINTTSPSYKLDVSGDIHCTGKITSDGGNDPPYVLYNYETRNSIVERVKKEISPSKLNGAVLFFDGEKQSLELFLPSKGEFRSLDGKLLEKVKPITKTFETKKRYYFDEETGIVKHYEAKKKKKKYRLRQNVFVDPLTGKFKKKIEETEKEIEISEKEAYEKKQS